MKTIGIVFLILLVTGLVVGCGPEPETSSIDTVVETTTTPPQMYIPPSPPFSVEVAFLDGAPALNEEAVIYCNVRSSFPLTDLTVEIELPEFLEPVDDVLSWSGDIEAGDDKTVIQADVRAIGIGNGVIQVRNAMVPESQANMALNTSWRPVLYVSVFTDSARWDVNPFWFDGGGLSQIPHKQGDPLARIQLYLSISHLPGPDEITELSCSIVPSIDCQDVKALVVLPESIEFIDGTLEWQGDLFADARFISWLRLNSSKPENVRLVLVYGAGLRESIPGNSWKLNT